MCWTITVLFLMEKALVYLLIPTPDLELSPTCNESGILGVVPGIWVLIQATEVLNGYWGGTAIRKKLLIADLLKMTFRNSAISNPDCPLCVHHQSFKDSLSNKTCSLFELGQSLYNSKRYA